MAWEEEKHGGFGDSLSKLWWIERWATHGVSELKHRRTVPLPGAKDTVWGEAGISWDKRGEACLENRHLLNSVGQKVDTNALFGLSCRRTLALTGDSFTSRLLS